MTMSTSLRAVALFMVDQLPGVHDRAARGDRGRYFKSSGTVRTIAGFDVDDAKRVER